MKRSIFKPVVFGILFGAAAFFAPFFLLKVVFFMLLVGFIFRMFWWRRQAWHYTMHHQMAYEKVRNMSEEEYSAFKNSFKNRQHYYGHCSWNDDGSCRSYSSCYDYEKRDTENKKEETEK